ncbi:MAG: DUF4198 domain-containing protein [Limnobacter sp.]|nr:DUF4198 domain-containing protein [Limnobacter sp.]
MRHYLSHKVSSRLIFIVVVTLGLPIHCFAHDTWLMPRHTVSAGDTGLPNAMVLLPGTGDFFPRPDFLTPKDRIETIQCAQVNQPVAHDLQHNPVLGFQIAIDPEPMTNPRTQPSKVPTFCTIKLEREYIELDLEKVAPYLDDIAANAKVRKAWAYMQSKGMIWKENYTKIARVELGGTLSNQPSKQIGQHTEIVSALPEQQLKRGKAAQFVLLHRGKPLAGHPVQWVGSANGQRGWLKTNSKGMVSVPIDARGDWMLRGTVIKLAKDETFESDFFTLVFAVSH